MQHTQNQNQELDPEELRKTLEGLGLFESPVKPGDEFKLYVAASSEEETRNAVNRLRLSFGWQPLEQVTAEVDKEHPACDSHPGGGVATQACRARGLSG
jgi:hypothetical protein